MTVNTGSEELVAAIMKATGAEEDLAVLGANFVVASRTRAMQPDSKLAGRAVNDARSELLVKAQFSSRVIRTDFFDQLKPFIHQ